MIHSVKLKLTGVFDNSESNRHQLNKPPKDVKWGPNSADEMLVMYMGFVERSDIF